MPSAQHQVTIRRPLYGRPIPADFEIVQFEPGKRLAFRVTAGPVRPEGASTSSRTAVRHEK